MISVANKIKLNIITLCLDFCLLYILEYENNLTDIDVGFIYSILFVHLFLYISLYKSWYTLVDILHVIMFVSLLCGMFLHNFSLKCLILSLMILIQVLWTIEKECIMNTKPFGAGYGKILGICTIFYTTFFSFQLGQEKKNNI